MAALQKIRSKAVLLTVVIGVALLAFIMGDALTQGRAIFGDGNTIAKVGSHKIDAMDFQNLVSERSQMYQQQGRSMDPAVVQQQVINEMIQKYLLEDELERVGIFVSDQELTDGVFTSPVFAQQLGINAQQMAPADLKQQMELLYDQITNPAKYGATAQDVAPMKAQWDRAKQDYLLGLKLNKLQILVSGAIQANDLDKKYAYEDNATTYAINFVKKDYASLDDAKFEVTDADLKAEYDKQKPTFLLEEGVEARAIHYIAVDIKPSATDRKAATEAVEAAVDTLKHSTGIDAVRVNSEFAIDETTVRLNDVTGDVKEFLATAAVGEVSPLREMQDTYSFTKLLNKKVEVDSVNVSMVVVVGDKKLQDSVLNKLQGGAEMAEVLAINGVQAQENQWNVLLGVPDSIKTKILNAPAGYSVFNAMDQGATFLKVNEKKAPKTLYEIANITYQVYPSTETVDGLRNGINEYLAANQDNKLFAENAAKAGYNAIETVVTETTPQIDRIENTRRMIRDIFSLKPGQVTALYDKENKDKMIAIAVDEVYKDGYLPVTATRVKSYLTEEARNSKKAESLIAEYKGKGKTVADYAKLMGAPVDTTTVVFGQPMIAKVGYGESALAGHVAASKTGVVSDVVKGKTGVYVYEVTNAERTERAMNPVASEREFATTRGANVVMQNAVQILRKASNVKLDMIKFF